MSEIGTNAGSGRSTGIRISIIPTIVEVRLGAAGSLMPILDNRPLVGRWLCRDGAGYRVGAFSYGAGADGSGPPSGSLGMTT